MTKSELNSHVSLGELSGAIASGSGFSPYALAQNKLKFQEHSFPGDKVVGSFETTKPHITVHEGIQYSFRLEKRKPNTARFQPDTSFQERKDAMEAIMLVGRADRIYGEDYVNVQDETNPGAERLVYISLYKNRMVDYDGKVLDPISEKLIVNLIESIPESSR